MRRAILLVDHGSRRAAANDLLLEVGRLVEALAPDEIVEVAHMELAEPTIEQGFAACVSAGAKDVTVHPYMLSPGRHSTTDIPRLVAEAAARHPGVTWRVTEPLGLDERLAELVVRRVESSRGEGGDVR